MKLKIRVLFFVFNILMFSFLIIFIIRSIILLKQKSIYKEPKKVVEDQKIPFVDIKNVYIKNNKIFCLNERFSTVMIYNSNGEHEKNITMPYYEKGENAIYFVNDILCIVDRIGNLYEFENNQLKYSIKCDYEKEKINVFKRNSKLIKSYSLDVSECTAYFYEENKLLIVSNGYKYEIIGDKKRKKDKFDYESIYSKELTAMDKNLSQYTIKGLNPRLIKTTEGKERILIKGSWIDWFLYSEKASSIVIIGIFITALFQIFLWKIKI